MRILDSDNDKIIKKMNLFLTPEEAHELKDSLIDLIKKPDRNHAHINDEDFEHEITVSIYTHDNIKYYDKRSQRIILKKE